MTFTEAIMGNTPSVRAIIEVLRADGATDEEIIEFLLKVLPPPK